MYSGLFPHQLAAALLLSVIAFTDWAHAQPATQPFQPKVRQEGKDVIWVPTPHSMVNTMLDMAKVTAKDYVIDLGSGDGRTVIAAAKRGARALGMDGLIGSIEVGKRADLTVLRTDGVHWTPMLDPVSNLVYSASGADVDTVIVDGKVLMEGRQMTTLDEEHILREARERAQGLFERAGLQPARTWPVL